MINKDKYLLEALDKLVLKHLNEGLDDIYNKYYAQAIPEREVFNRIIAIDPTYKPDKDKMGSYGQWLLNLYKRGEDLFSEEKEFKDQLLIFNTTKNKLPQDKRDISRIKTLKELIELNASMEDRVTKSELQLKAEEHPGATFICKNSNWEVYRPETYEASKFLRGDDAVWCTGRHGDDYFWKEYTRNGGKLFIFINTSKDKDEHTTKYQVAIRDDRVTEFRDARNESVNFLKFLGDNDLYKVLGETDIAHTKDYQAIKRVKDTGGKILYSELMAIKFTPNGSNNELFEALQNFIDVIIVNDGLKRLLPDAFKLMLGVKKIILPDSLQTIGSNCFDGCKNLKKISIPERVSSIPTGCFKNCSSLVDVSFGKNVIDIKSDAFKGCSEELKIKTPHHRITILKSELPWYKNHVVWTDDVEESLTEDLSTNVPKWFKPYLANDHRNGYYGGEYLLSALLNHNIDVSKFKIIEAPMPKDKNDPIFTDENKYLIFYIPKENCNMYRSDKNWGRYDGGSIVYIKDINSPTTGSYAQDSVDRRTPYQLLKMATKFAYIDKTDPNNFNTELRDKRRQSKQGTIDRDREHGQVHEIEWVLKSKYPDRYKDDIYYSKKQAFDAWRTEKQGWRDDAPLKRDIYEKPVPVERGWTKTNPKERDYYSHYDKSGFDTRFARHVLTVKLNDYRKRNYQQTLDNMRNNLEVARRIILDLFNSSLSDLTAIDDESVNASRLMSDFKDCAKNYSKIISRLDYIEQMDNPEAQEKELDNLFSVERSYSHGFGITVKEVIENIQQLLQKLSKVETTYIESLN